MESSGNHPQSSGSYPLGLILRPGILREGPDIIAFPS
jgi:hypothetical protein